MWEIGNEYNLHQFLHPLGYNKSDSNTWFNYSDTVDITTDLLYYGSRGINASNPNATTVMGGLVPGGNGIQDIENFLRSIYENIEGANGIAQIPTTFSKWLVGIPTSSKKSLRRKTGSTPTSKFMRS